MRPTSVHVAIRVILAISAALAAPATDAIECNPMFEVGGCGPYGWRYGMQCLALSETGHEALSPFPLLWDGCYPGGFPRVFGVSDGPAVCLGPYEDCDWVAKHELRTLFLDVLLLSLRAPGLVEPGWDPKCVPGACLMILVRVANGTVSGVHVQSIVRA